MAAPATQRQRRRQFQTTGTTSRTYRSGRTWRWQARQKMIRHRPPTWLVADRARGVRAACARCEFSGGLRPLDNAVADARARLLRHECRPTSSSSASMPPASRRSTTGRGPAPARASCSNSLTARRRSASSSTSTSARPRTRSTTRCWTPRWRAVATSRYCCRRSSSTPTAPTVSCSSASLCRDSRAASIWPAVNAEPGCRRPHARVAQLSGPSTANASPASSIRGGALARRPVGAPSTIRSRPRSFTYVSYVDVLEGRVPRGAVRRQDGVRRRHRARTRRHAGGAGVRPAARHRGAGAGHRNRERGCAAAPVPRWASILLLAGWDTAGGAAVRVELAPQPRDAGAVPRRHRRRVDRTRSHRSACCSMRPRRCW